MFKSIEIGGTPVEFLGTAATNIYFKRIFGDDPIAIQDKKDLSAAERIDLYSRLAYVMHEQAAHVGDKESMSRANEDSYVEWLDSFDFGEFGEKLDEIGEVYMGQQGTSSKAKKK